MAVKQDRQCRAADIADSMPSSHAIQLAGKYAARLRLGVLADHLNEMSLRRMAESDSYLPSVYETNDQFSSISNYVPSTVNSTNQVGQQEDPNLPVLATPPVVTLVKRPLAGLTPHSGGSSLRQETVPEPEPEREDKKESATEISDDEHEEEEEVEENDEEVEDENSRDSEPPVSAPSRNPFSASKKNPFAKASASSTTSSKDAFSCFEKVDPPKVKSSTTSVDSAKKKRQPRKSNTDNGEVKRKKTATKRKSDEDNANNENEDTTESNYVEAQEPKTKKTAITSKKLTDFMFTKN